MKILITLRIFIVILTGAAITVSCAGTAPKPPEKESAQKPGEKFVWVEKDDNRLNAYTSYMISVYNRGNGRLKEAQEYLSRALEYDPDARYLNLEMAVLLKEQGDYQGALKFARKGVEMDPDDIPGRVLLADIYALSGKHDAALAEYNKILELDPSQLRIKLIVTTMLIKREDYPRALEYLDAMLKEDPALVIAHYYRGRVLMEMKDYGGAEKAYLAALKVNPRMQPSLFDLATLYQMTKRNGKSAETYEQLLRFYPKNNRVRERLINLYYELGKTDEAEREMAKIKAQAKPGEPGRQTLGLIYLRHGKLDESIEELSLILSAWPEDDKSRYYLATAWDEKENPEKALENFRMIKKDSNFFVDAQLNIGYILQTQKKYKAAIEVLEQAIPVDPKKAAIYLMLASSFEALEEYDKAMATVRKGLEQDPDNTDLIFRMGVILDKEGKKEACLTQMQRVVALDPEHAEALNYIGYTYAEQGIRLDEAMALIQKALKLKPESGYIVDSLAWVYFQRGQYAVALKHLKKAITLTPSDPTITEHLGDVYLKSGNYKKSLEMYEKALSRNHPKPEKIKKKLEGVKKILRKQGNNLDGQK